MSRHRFVRNLVHEDDYYDDDDDYWEDDGDYGDDYDDSYAPPKRNNNTNNKNKNSATTNIKPSTTAVPATTTAKLVITNKPIAKTAATTVGVTKPPPGWGKPSSTNTTSKTVGITTSGGGGVMKPPPGWGKPNASASGGASGGISTPPPGWGKPTSASAGGVTKPPPGWGKPTNTSTTVGGTSSSTESTTTAQSTTQSSKQDGKSNVTTSSNYPKQSKKPLPEILTKKDAIRSQLAMVVLGHVDAGKSTLMGQLLVQIGQVSKRTATKTQQLAWLLDEDESEQERGVTMQIGTKSFATPSHDIVVLDAPGHADFIPIMITGAAQADVAILVVAATKGEFEAGFDKGGQTKEHIILARGLGVTQVIVAINKLDVMEWDQARYIEIQQIMQDYLLQQQFGAKRIRFIPISGLTGENVKSVTDTTLTAWYKGPTLLESIDSFQSANRNFEKPLRFVISDVYAEGKGVTVRGRVVQGFLQVGERIEVLPIGDSATVTKLEHLQPPLSSDPTRLSIAIAGDTVEFILLGIDVMRVSVGAVLANSNARPPMTKKVTAKILVMDNLAIPIIRGAQVLFHMHSLDVPANMSKLIAITNHDGSIKRERPRSLTGGSSAKIELTLSDRICIEPFKECRALGRFVLRRGGDTIAVGIVDDVIL